MTGPTNRKNLLTFGGNPVLETISGSVFHVPCHCAVADFMTFIGISHTVTGRFSWHSATWLTPTWQWIHNILGTIRQTSGFQSGIPVLNPGSPWLKRVALAGARCLQAHLVLRLFRYQHPNMAATVPQECSRGFSDYCNLTRCRRRAPLIKSTKLT